MDFCSVTCTAMPFITVAQTQRFTSVRTISGQKRAEWADRVMGNYFLSDAGRVVKVSGLRTIRFNVSNTRSQTSRRRRRRRNIIIEVTRRAKIFVRFRRGESEKTERKRTRRTKEKRTDQTDGNRIKNRGRSRETYLYCLFTSILFSLREEKQNAK